MEDLIRQITRAESNVAHAQAFLDRKREEANAVHSEHTRLFDRRTGDYKDVEPTREGERAIAHAFREFQHAQERYEVAKRALDDLLFELDAVTPHFDR